MPDKNTGEKFNQSYPFQVGSEENVHNYADNEFKKEVCILDEYYY